METNEGERCQGFILHLCSAQIWAPKKKTDEEFLYIIEVSRGLSRDYIIQLWLTQRPEKCILKAHKKAADKRRPFCTRLSEFRESLHLTNQPNDSKHLLCPEKARSMLGNYSSGDVSSGEGLLIPRKRPAGETLRKIWFDHRQSLGKETRSPGRNRTGAHLLSQPGQQLRGAAHSCKQIVIRAIPVAGLGSKKLRHAGKCL